MSGKQIMAHCERLRKCFGSVGGVSTDASTFQKNISTEKNNIFIENHGNNDEQLAFVK